MINKQNFSTFFLHLAGQFCKVVLFHSKKEGSTGIGTPVYYNKARIKDLGVSAKFPSSGERVWRLWTKMWRLWQSFFAICGQTFWAPDVKPGMKPHSSIPHLFCIIPHCPVWDQFVIIWFILVDFGLILCHFEPISFMLDESDYFWAILGQLGPFLAILVLNLKPKLQTCLWTTAISFTFSEFFLHKITAQSRILLKILPHNPRLQEDLTIWQPPSTKNQFEVSSDGGPRRLTS